MTHISMKRVAYFGSCLLNLRRDQGLAELDSIIIIVQSVAASQLCRSCAT